VKRLGILHVALSGRNGGAEVQSAALTAGLARRGHRVLGLLRRGTPLERRSIQAGAPIFPLQPAFPAGPGGVLTWWSRSRLRHLASRGDWDLIHFDDPRSLGAVAPILAGVSGNGVLPPSRVLVSWRGPSGSAPGAPPALRRHHRQGGFIHVASEAVWSALVREGFDEDRLAVIHPGIPIEEHAVEAEGREKARRLLGLADSDAVIGTIAIFDRERGVGDLIDAAPAILGQRPRARIVIVGDGPRRSGLESRARSAGLGDRVLFAGWRDDVARLLRAFDVYAFTGRGEEVFPLSLVEAMASGVPVVVCDQPGIREIIENGKQGLFVPGTGAESLARTILRALADPEVSRSMGRAGAVRVQRFTTRAMLDATEQLYYRLTKAGA